MSNETASKAVPAPISDLVLQITCPVQGSEGSAVILDAGGCELDASKYEDWAIGAKVFSHTYGHSEDGFKWFSIWSCQAACVETYSSEHCRSIWDSLAPEPAPLTLEQRFHAGDVSTEEAINLLAKNPVVIASLRKFYPDVLTAKEARAVLDYILLYSRMLQAVIHGLNVAAGWWSDLDTGEPKERNDGELCMLIVTEISEGFEGVRKNLMDDKLGHRKMFEVELGDAMIRELDVGGGRGFDLFAALFEKLAYNQCRSDHKREARLAPHGKKC